MNPKINLKRNAVFWTLPAYVWVGASLLFVTSCGKKHPATEQAKTDQPVALTPAHPGSEKTGDVVPQPLDPKLALQQNGGLGSQGTEKQTQPSSKTKSAEAGKDSRDSAKSLGDDATQSAQGTSSPADSAGTHTGATETAKAPAPVLGPVIIGVTPGTEGAQPVPQEYKTAKAPVSKPAGSGMRIPSSTTQPAPGAGSGSSQDVGSLAPQTGTSSADGAKSAPAPSAPSKELVQAEPPKPAEPEHGCFTVTYNHKATPGHLTGDACSQHRNLITLKHTQINMKSICVRVDGTPVRYSVYQNKKKKDDSIQLMIGPVAGPKAKITARYCMTKSNCNEDCKVPKDEFLEALGGNVDDSQVAKWDPADGKKDNTDVTSQIDAEVQRELAGYTDLSIFNDWIGDTQAPACGG